MSKKHPEIELLKELVELDKLDCPMILVIGTNPDGSIDTNCPNKGKACYCKGKGRVIKVNVQGE